MPQDIDDDAGLQVNQTASRRWLGHEYANVINLQIVFV